MSAEKKQHGLRAGVLDQRNWSAEMRRLNPHLTGRYGDSRNGDLTITLPLPPRELSPNARCHWAKKAGAVKAYRLRAQVECGSRAELHRAATVQIQWFTRTTVHPDRDNALSSLKPLFDGVTDSGFMDDDRELSHEPIQFAKDAANPRVVLTFTPK